MCQSLRFGQHDGREAYSFLCFLNFNLKKELLAILGFYLITSLL